MRSVILEGLAIGLLASVIGLLAGFGIYKGLDALFVALGADLPKTGTVAGHAHDHRVAAGRHGRDAAREHPARPARDPGAADRGGARGRRAPAVAGRGALGEAGGRPDRRVAGRDLRPASSPAWARSASRCCSAAASCRCSSASRWPRRGWSSRSRGWWAGRAGAPGASPASWPAPTPSATRRRTASTAAALMIGLTLVTVVAVLGAGLRSSVEGAVTDQVKADYILDNPDDVSFGSAEGDAVAAVDGVTTALARPHRHRAGRRRGVRSHRHRPGDDRPLLHVRLGARRRPHGARDGRRRRGRGQGLRGGHRTSAVGERAGDPERVRRRSAR